MKRLVDLLASIILLILLFPLLLLVTLAVKLGSRGPAFYRQKRIGRGCQEFYILKFRSMVVDAQTVGPMTTSKEDPRITRIGRFLRKTNLDELPQLLNVLKGDMSLVGPRPDQPFQMSDYTEEERTLRHSVRPGITGWAQVKRRHEATLAERKALDLEYVQKAGILFDLKILILTVVHVFSKKNY